MNFHVDPSCHYPCNQCYWCPSQPLQWWHHRYSPTQTKEWSHGDQQVYLLHLCCTCLVRVLVHLVTPGGGLQIVRDDGAPGDQVQQEAHPQGGHQVGGHGGQPGLQALTGGQGQVGLDVTETDGKFTRLYCLNSEVDTWDVLWTFLFAVGRLATQHFWSVNFARGLITPVVEFCNSPREGRD